jgi:hypothetical protein
MAELGWLVLETTQEHLQNLVSQGYMSWRARRFMSEDLVHLRTDSSTHYCSSMAWSCII